LGVSINSKLSQIAKSVLDFYIPIALEIPSLRDNPELMIFEVKAENSEGVQDIATQADKYVQAEIKKQLPENWQFWGEEGADNVTEFDESKEFILITDPIEGTNNFRAKLDNQWGSVVSIVDIKTKEPVIGIVAHPTEMTFYLGIIGSGAFKLTIKDDILQHSKLTSEPEAGYDYFTYNNSPHFNEELSNRVSNFLAKGAVQDMVTEDKLLASRKKLTIEDHRFEDPESGALEVVRNKGTIYFKTSNEMSACFVILKELGGYITDGNGIDWTLGISTLISARTKEDYEFLKELYDRSRS
jgi:fructose-1,6-bisphosphatase/inositol monophosphatase family enzyme